MSTLIELTPWSDPLGDPVTTTANPSDDFSLVVPVSEVPLGVFVASDAAFTLRSASPGSIWSFDADWTDGLATFAPGAAALIVMPGEGATIEARGTSPITVISQALNRQD